jgi:hypothetical protein
MGGRRGKRRLRERRHDGGEEEAGRRRVRERYGT